MSEHHVHDIMDMMAETGKQYNFATLRDDILEHFGQEARFFSCKGNAMDADEAIVFMAQRGKFIGTEESFTTIANHSCSH